MSDARCRILYVDDHEDSAEMLRLLLASNYEVHSAESFEKAIQMAQATQFNLYILDKRLPDGSGIELCRKLNTLAPGVPTIFYTGDAYEVHRQEAMGAGADAYIPKPDVEALIETVHKFLAECECGTA